MPDPKRPSDPLRTVAVGERIGDLKIKAATTSPAELSAVVAELVELVDAIHFTASTRLGWQNLETRR